MKKYYQKNRIKSSPKGRKFVVGDIHGCYKTFKALIKQKIKLKKKDQLFLLGDYVYRGPESKKTLNYIIKLIKKGFKVYPLRGNHEQVLLDATQNKKTLNWIELKNPEMLKNKNLRKKHRKFLNSLPFYYELDNFFLVHACFNFSVKNPFQDTETMLWGRNFEYNSKILKGKTLIHGHQPEAFEKIAKNIENKEKIIGLDNGVCYTKKHKYYDYTKMGKLCALNLDTFELIVQTNLEQQN